MNNPGRGARNLATGGALSNSARSLANSEVYYSYIAPAVLSEIDLIRKLERIQILKKQSCSIGTYPPARAINDALNYHETCSFISGLSSLLKKAGVQTREGDGVSGVLAGNVQQRVAEVEKAITSEKAKLATLTDGTPAHAASKSRLVQLEASLLHWKEMQVLTGTEQPLKYGLAANSFASQIADAELKLDIVNAKLQAAGANPAAALLNDVSDAKKNLADAMSKQSKAQIYERNIARLHCEIASLEARRLKEIVAGNGKVVTQITADIADKEKLLTTVQDEQLKLGLPDGYNFLNGEPACLN
jgi:hypothetical protein